MNKKIVTILFIGMIVLSTINFLSINSISVLNQNISELNTDNVDVTTGDDLSDSELIREKNIISPYEFQAISNLQSNYSISLHLNKSSMRVQGTLQSYYFIRSSIKVGYDIFPTSNLVLINWDGASNSSSMPLSPAISTTSEQHQLNFFVNNSVNTFEKYSFNVTIDDTAVISSISSPLNVKVKGDEIVTLAHDGKAKATTWAFNSGVFTALPKITFPVDASKKAVQGNQILRVHIIDIADRAWDYDFPFFVDWTAPVINLLNANNNSIYNSGTTLLFENKTPVNTFDDKYNFTFQWNDGAFFHTMPMLPAPNGLQKLLVLLSDEIGNSNNKTYIFTSSIGLAQLTPSQSGRPNQSISVSFTEMPVYSNFTLRYTNQLNSSVIVQTNMTSPGNLPDVNQNIDLIINVKDTGDHWYNKTFNIKVDGYPIEFLSANIANNSIVTQNTNNQAIALYFNETPHTIIYNFNNTNTNTTRIPYIPYSTGIYKLSVFYSDLAGNWAKISLVYTRILAISVNITNNQEINPLSVLKFSMSENTTEYIDNLTLRTVQDTSQIFLTTPSTSRMYSYSFSAKSNDTISTLTIHYYIKITAQVMDDLTRPYQSGLKINFSFSEAPYSWFYVWDSANDVNQYKFDQTPITPQSTGAHILYFKMYNSIDNIEFVDSVTFVIDNTKPIFSPKNFANNSVYRVNYTLGYSLSADVITKQYYWDDNYKADLQSLVTPLSNGTHILHIYLKDKADNQATFIYQLSVDSVKPLLYSNKENNSIIFKTDTLVFNFSEPIDTSSSYYIYNGVTYSAGKDIEIKNFEWGNTTFNISFFIVDYFQNNIQELYFFRLVDPALNLSVNAPENGLLYNANEKVVINLSKQIKDFTAVWTFSNGTPIESSYTITKNDVTYTIAIPDAEGSVFLAYNITTMDKYVIQEKKAFFIDLKNPLISLDVNQVRDNKDNIKRVYESTESEILFNISANDLVNLTIQDSSTISSYVTLSYSNGSTFNFTTPLNTITFYTPGRNQYLNVTITTTDAGGHISTRTWKLLVFDRPEMRIPSFELTTTVFLLLVVALAFKKKERGEV